MNLNNKANTLKKLRINGAIIPKLKIYKVEKFLQNNKFILNDIKNRFGSKVAIRSSAFDEDQPNKSNAGKFESFLNINPKNLKDTNIKIKKVINSYKTKKKGSEFFIQYMVKNISISGVVLTRNLENYNKCININYYKGNDSSKVTSGAGGSDSILFYENKKYKIDRKFKKLVSIVKNLKEKTKNENLDIEFAIDKKGKVYILQVRNLIIPKKKINNNEQIISLQKLEKKIKKLKQKHHALFGNTTYFGVMPDWNPAEIIGVKPKPLALSLYRELITDHVWSDNRKIYGYKDLSQFHLMTTFYGTPFIDVRIDFNSWLPNSLPNKISKNVMNYYLKTFKNEKSFHDKIEFEIVFSCYTLSTKNKINQKLRKFLNGNERTNFINELKNINKIAVSQIDKDYKLIEELIKKQELIEKSSLYYIDKIYWLVEDCKKYGTLPFAGLARCGFIAMEILNSFVEKKILTENDKLNFLSSIKTITSEMKEDIHKDKKFFIKKFGHLRPGTYEITSLNYKENFNKYFNNFNKKKINRNYRSKKFIFNKIQKNKINKFINENEAYKDFDSLIEFITKSIRYREYSKFIFSKSIDLIFNNIQKFGKKFSIKRDQLSYLKIIDILDLYFNLSEGEPINNIKKRIKENKIEYFKNKKIDLPDVIISPEDLYVQKKAVSKINYISNKTMYGKILDYKKTSLNSNFDKVVCIENADPGYDFLFSKNIKGLVTKYGGQNSHMAIRCAEHNIPAILGIGEKNFSAILNSKNLVVDFSNENFTIL